jgi:glycosyltransferase involved in cell wall biosynthesis
MNSPAPLFSIIVPTYNEELLLPRLLESLRRQSFQDYETIVADDKSTDLTQKIALKYGARLIVNNGIGEYPSRNAAASIARGSILIFTGADTLMPPDLLKAVAMKFDKDQRLAGIYCPTYPYDAPFWAKAEFTLWYVLTTLVYWITKEANASTAFFAVRTEVFRATGGFHNTAFADSSLARQISRSFKVRPQLDLVIFVSGRRTSMGIAGFNRYHLAMIMEVVFRFFRRSHWLRAENDYRILLHTKSKQSES